MSILTDTLYWLSTGMLIPVIVLLLFCFGWALALVGDLYGRFARRLRTRESTAVLVRAVRQQGVLGGQLSEKLHADATLRDPIEALEASHWHPVHGDKTVCDFERGCRRGVESASLLTRVGPMLGLMGTLIPMGPALVGLAAGDIASMADNMQVAFSTTVLGIFVGAVGLLVQVTKKRWAQTDSELLRYLLELALSEPRKAQQNQNEVPV